MDLQKTITLEELAQFCAEYDRHGKERYQEHVYEGHSFFESLYSYLTNGDDIPEELENKYFPYKE